MQAPAPERLIKGGLPTEAMVAHVLVAKYAWHLPLYRQAQMLLEPRHRRSIARRWRSGWAMRRRSSSRCISGCATILGSAKIAVDETTAPVLDPGRGRTKTGYFWAIARDDRPWGGTDPPAVAYTYAPGRGAVHGLKLLESYRGIVQCDGYAAYKTIADDARTGDAITLAFCWAHLRRQFFDIAKGGRRRSRAKRWSASPHSMRSRRRSAATAPMSAAPCARRRANRSCWRSKPGSNSSSRASRRSPSLPKSSATA